MQKNIIDHIKRAAGIVLEKILLLIGVLLPVFVALLLFYFIGGSDFLNPPQAPEAPETLSSIELTAKDGYQTVPYDVKDLLPGDSVTQCYCISVTHEKAETVRFGIAVDTSQMLSRVLRVKVEEIVPDAEEKILYNGLMSDCIAVDRSISANSETVTPLYYRITAYTDGAEVGNEYKGESLVANFWWQIQ